MILAALLHDIGHMVGLSKGNGKMVTDGVVLGASNHEDVGMYFLYLFRWLG